MNQCEFKSLRPGHRTKYKRDWEKKVKRSRFAPLKGKQRKQVNNDRQRKNPIHDAPIWNGFVYEPRSCQNDRRRNGSDDCPSWSAFYGSGPACSPFFPEKETGHEWYYPTEGVLGINRPKTAQVEDQQNPGSKQNEQGTDPQYDRTRNAFHELYTVAPPKLYKRQRRSRLQTNAKTRE